MRIDAHQHFWQYDPVKDTWIDDSMTAIARDFMPQDLSPVLQSQGFSGCVAVQAAESTGETDFLLALAESSPWIRKVVGWLDPASDIVEAELERLEGEARLAGFRHILQACAPERMAQPAYRKGMHALGKKGYTFDLLVYPHHLGAATELVQANPDLPFVIDHMAKPDITKGLDAEWEKDIRQIAGCENVYCKVSGLVTEAEWNQWDSADFTPFLDVVFDAFGVQRLMYGSDWPVCLLAAAPDAVVDLVESYMASCSEDERARVFGGTASHFYGMTV